MHSACRPRARWPSAILEEVGMHNPNRMSPQVTKLSPVLVCLTFIDNDPGNYLLIQSVYVQRIEPVIRQS